MFEKNPALFIVMGNILFFPAMWILVSFLISKMGRWSLLAKKFRTDKKITGDRYRFQSGRFGLTNYNGVLTITVGNQGIHLAVFPLFRAFHPPLLLPWDAVRNIEIKKIFFYRYVKFDICYPDTITSLMLSTRIMNSLYWRERFPEAGEK